jgi:hypothetical protein
MTTRDSVHLKSREKVARALASLLIRVDPWLKIFSPPLLQ